MNTSEGCLLVWPRDPRLRHSSDFILHFCNWDSEEWEERSARDVQNLMVQGFSCFHSPMGLGLWVDTRDLRTRRLWSEHTDAHIRDIDNTMWFVWNEYAHIRHMNNRKRCNEYRMFGAHVIKLSRKWMFAQLYLYLCEKLSFLELQTHLCSVNEMTLEKCMAEFRFLVFQIVHSLCAKGILRDAYSRKKVHRSYVPLYHRRGRINMQRRSTELERITRLVSGTARCSPIWLTIFRLWWLLLLYIYSV